MISCIYSISQLQLKYMYTVYIICIRLTITLSDRLTLTLQHYGVLAVMSAIGGNR